VFQIVLGLLFWSGHAQNLIPVHMLVGIVFVLSLWTVAALAVRAGVSGGLIALTFVWGVVVLLLGIAQAPLFPGPNHWIVRVLHLLVGLAAMGQASGLVRRIGAQSRQNLAVA
jgi:hypothetical protein